MPGTIGIIQARLGSSRLPAKILAPIGDRTLLGMLVARLGTAEVDEWWLATTASREDDVTEAWGHALGLRVFRGSVVDVLSRCTAIIRARDPEWIVRITADDPFIDGAVVNVLLDAREKEGRRASCLHVARHLAESAGENEIPPSPPLGYGAQIARAEAVLRSESEIPPDQPYHRAHVLSWLDQNDSCSVALPADWPSRPEWRWTVDTFEDLTMTRSAFGLFGLGSTRIGYPEMVALLDGHPEITAINRHVVQKEVEEG